MAFLILIQKATEPEYTKDGLFVKDISNSKEGKILNGWVRSEGFEILATRYINSSKNSKLEEYILWPRIENNINEVNAE